ncbi:MAG: hypothetical protein GY870_00885 [archaeon]|nr:hypothetical protein [archaeon]
MDIKSIKSGNKYRLKYPDVGGEKNPHNRIVHIVAVVNDCDSNLFVVKSWINLGWRYELQNEYFFHIGETMGHLSLIKN